MYFMMMTYAAVFAVILFVNIFYWIRIKSNILMLLYELLSGAYLILLIMAYCSPLIMNFLGFWGTLPLLPVIGMDLYLTVWGDLEKMTPEGMEISEEQLETAKTISVFFAAPAYIIGALVFFDAVRRMISADMP